MKYFTVAAFVALAAAGAQAQSVITIPAGAKIYVDAASGFDTRFAAAIKDQGIPLEITTKKAEADYELEAMSGERKIPASAWSVLWGRGDDQATIRVIDLHTSEIVFVYTLQRSKKIVYDPKTTADACAKQLKFGMNPATIPQKERLEPKNPALDF
jgi:hypothetical protein